MSAKEIEVDTPIDLKGMKFGEASDALRDVKQAKGYVNKAPDGVHGKWAFCFSFLPGEFTEGELFDLIGAEYGAGIYPVQFKTPNKGGREQFRWQQNFEVQARRLGAQPQPQAPTSTPAAALPGNGALAAALTSIADTQARILDALTSRPDPPAPKDTIEIAKDLAALKDLFSDDKQTVLEQVKDVLELKQLLMETNDVPTDPIAAALKYLGPAIKKGMDTQPQPEPTRSARVAPPPPQPERPSSDAEDEELDEYAQRINAMPPIEIQIDQAFNYFAVQFMPAALQLAEQNREPEEVANYLANLIGSDVEVLNRVGLVLSQDDMVGRFIGFDESVKKYGPWFDSVGDWLAYALWPDANDPPGTHTATFDATIDKTAGAGVIKSSEPQGDTDDDSVAGSELHDAQRTDPPRTGDDNDA